MAPLNYTLAEEGEVQAQIPSTLNELCERLSNIDPVGNSAEVSISKFVSANSDNIFFHPHLWMKSKAVNEFLTVSKLQTTYNLDTNFWISPNKMI